MKKITFYIYFACLSVYLPVSNKRQKDWTDRAQNFCGTSRDPRKGLWMIKISKISLQQIFKNQRIFFIKMFTIIKEDGRKAHWKPSKKTKPKSEKKN